MERQKRVGEVLGSTSRRFWLKQQAAITTRWASTLVVDEVYNPYKLALKG